MGFYIRKSINLGGGIRLNLSKGGLGVSGGVKGFRVGMNGRGTYVHMGRGGLYYRKQFSYSSPRRSSAGQPYAPATQPQHQSEIIFTEDLARPLDVTSGEAGIDDVLEHFKLRGIGWTKVAVAFGIAAIVASPYSTGWAIFWAICGAAAVVIGFLRRPNRGLMYDLEGHALTRYEAFVNAFESFFRSDKLWLYETRSLTHDWKRNAGASSLIKRLPAAMLPEGDKRIRSNISIPCLIAGKDRIYFLPDLIVCAHDNQVSGFRYPDSAIDAQSSSFIEEEGVARDAQVISWTWQYVNKRGGPDLRFKNNRELPVCAYQQVFLDAGGAFQRTFCKSRLTEFRAFERAFDELRKIILTAG